MGSKAKLLGHPIHPMVLVFPLGLLSTAVVFDLIHLVTGSAEMSVVGFWLAVAGVVSGPVAALFGWIDWFAIPSGTRAKTIGLWHGIGNMLFIGLFLVAVVLRANEPNYAVTPLAIALELIAVGLSLVTGWLGGELIHRLSVSVDAGANLNAENSLTNPEEPGRRQTAGQTSSLRS